MNIILPHDLPYPYSVNTLLISIILSCMQDPEFRSTVPRLIIDGNEIDNVQYAKRLGVTISSDLTWNKHVENIVAKAGKRVSMLYQLERAGIGQHDLVTII